MNFSYSLRWRDLWLVIILLLIFATLAWIALDLNISPIRQSNSATLILEIACYRLISAHP